MGKKMSSIWDRRKTQRIRISRSKRHEYMMAWTCQEYLRSTLISVLDQVNSIIDYRNTIDIIYLVFTKYSLIC